MNNKDYQKLKSVIQEAVPSLMELEFGCDMVDKFKNEYYIGYEGRLFQKLGDGNECDPELTGSLKILGKPIRLADVLIALGNIVYLTIPADTYCIHPVLLIMDRENTHPRAEWNLSKNSLDLQTPEVKQFLHDILITKE